MSFIFPKIFARYLQHKIHKVHLKFPPPNHWPPTTAEYSINFENIY